MSVSIDKDPAAEGEDARAVLAGWLDDYAVGRCDRSDMQESFLSVCRSNSDAPWDALALLDQYQRRGRIDGELAQSLKTDIAQLVFGVANQTEAPPHSASAAREAATEAEAKSEAEAQPETEAQLESAAQAETAAKPEAKIDASGSRWRKLIDERDAATDRAEPSFDPTVFRRDFDPVTRPAVMRTPAASRPSPMPQRSMRDVLRDRYELLSVVGRGSTGTVYRALDRRRAHLPEAARCVAVKVLKLDYQERPEAQAEIEQDFHQAQSLAHPNIASVYDLDRHGGTYFLVMELLEGELLADVQRRLDGRPLRREHALNLIGSIGAALAYAHRRDVVHGDLKPRNIMITYGGEVRVLDFGFARSRAIELHSASSLQDAPQPAPAYASLERVNGSKPHASDDVYSLACIAYELLSGRHPFGGRSAVLARAHGRRPQRIAGLTHKQWQALQRALLWTRGERRIDLVELLDGLGCAQAPHRLVPPDELTIPVGRSFKWLKSGGLIALLLVLLAGVGVLFWHLERLEAEHRRAAPVAAPLPADADRVQEVEPLRPTSPSTGSDQAQVPPARAPAAEAAPRVAAPSTPPQTGSQDRPAARTDAAKGSVPQPAAPARPVTIAFDKDTYVVTESAGYVGLTVRRTGSTRRPASFRWVLKGNSAEAGADFANIGPALEQFPAGAREVTITIPLVSDAMPESTEMFLVEIEPAQDGVVLGELSHAAVIVVDDD
jgi:Protein kinase domain/Calx-beta domain